MNKDWFIFKGTHHLGPFSLEEMEEFFAVGEINAQSLVWREGAEKWEALSKTRDLGFLINKAKTPVAPSVPSEPTELPPLPIEEEDELPPPTPSGLVNSAMSEDFGDGPPPIPLDAILNPKGRTFNKPQSSLTKNSQKLVLAGIAAVFVIVMAWFFMNEKSSAIQLRIKGVMPIYVEKLQETAAQNTPSISIAMALSLDGKTLYASTNKEGEILSIIKLQSLPKRILGTEDVEIMVRGTIKNHIGEFARMQLTKGPQFVPGEYSIDFTGRKLHFLNRKFKFLNKYSFFKKLNTDYTYTTSALIYSGTPREFEKKITEYKETIVNEKLKPLSDKLERMQTFLSILNKTVEDYLLALESLKKPKDISKFESQYIKEISPIIQSMVLASVDLQKKLESDEIDTRNKLASYGTQVHLGKQIGELGSDMITETAKMKKISSSDKAALKNKFEQRYKMIKSQIDSHVTKLQAEIQKISN
jgi:hypothetical protein